MSPSARIPKKANKQGTKKRPRIASVPKAVPEKPPRRLLIGFIGQGWIGKHLADHYEERGFDIVRYSKEREHAGNQDAIAKCDIVFIAVPTPTTPDGFDDGILRNVIPHIGKGKIAVIKSTVLPGTTDALQEKYPGIIILHSPEFLREASVKQDVDHPARNIVGIPQKKFHDPRWRKAADLVMSILPEAPYGSVCTATEAEITKYAGNNFLFTKVVFMNLMYDFAEAHGARWNAIAANVKADTRIGGSHIMPVHQHAHLSAKPGRGAGGHCLIKDFAAFRVIFEKMLGSDKESIAILRALEVKNMKLLRDSGKDLDLLAGVYGEDA
jgi:nucleotide sugar dehydrogenase